LHASFDASNPSVAITPPCDGKRELKARYRRRRVSGFLSFECPSLPKNKMIKTPISHYRGYAVRPSAHRLPDGYFSADVVLERLDATAEARHYRFDSLAYFDGEIEATRFSRRWAENWIESRG
jgi:hypothetical protein